MPASDPCPHCGSASMGHAFADTPAGRWCFECKQYEGLAPAFMAAGGRCCASPDLLYVSPELSECLDCGAVIAWQHETIRRPVPVDTMREHHPGSLAGAIMFYAWRGERFAIHARVRELPNYPPDGCCYGCAPASECHCFAAAVDAPAPVRIPGTPRHR